MAGRRADGMGTISRRADGRRQGRIWLGIGPDGRRQRHSVYGRTRYEVVDKLRKVRNRIEEGRPPTDDATTVAEYLRWWAEHVLPGTVRDTTAYGYRRLIENTIIPAIGHHRIGRLTPAHVHAMLRDLSPATCLIWSSNARCARTSAASSRWIGSSSARGSGLFCVGCDSPVRSSR